MPKPNERELKLRRNLKGFESAVGAIVDGGVIQRDVLLGDKLDHLLCCNTFADEFLKEQIMYHINLPKLSEYILN